MKRQICFAGFAERELAAIQPSLAALSASWDCVFSPDAASALTALAETPFDAIVANLSPDGINDSELLHQAAVRHPRTLRFVLGNVGDQELMVNCMGAAHQFISRPWKPSELVSIIERSFALDRWLANDTLRSFVPRLGKLPSLPATYFEVLKKAESPHSSVESIAEIIARDPALTARLLQMVNSPACGLSEIVTSPAEAVSMLGLETVKSIVLCLQVIAHSAATKTPSHSLEPLWTHSFRVAKLAAKIVLRCIGSERMASDAYTAGLLHNIGQIVLATNLASEYAAVVEAAEKQKCPLQEMELKQLGVTSNHVGAYLLGVWGMPLALVEATALHYTPALGTMSEFSLLTVVHVANVLAHEETKAADDLPLPHLDADYLATLELPQKTKAWRKLLADPQANVSPMNTSAENPAYSPIPQLKDERRPPGKFFVVASVAVIVVAVVMLKKHAVNVNNNNTTDLTTAGSLAPGATEKTNASAGRSAFDSIKVQAIIYNAQHPVTLINGKALDIGERIDGVEVVSIEPTHVVLAFNGEQKIFKIK